MKRTIRQIVEGRGIGFLLHFTPAPNLPGIIEHGLLSRDDLRSSSRFAFVSDTLKLDGRDDAISLSIGRTNELMFASKRHGSPDANWVILVLQPEILWTHRCLFAWRNAASREITDHYGHRGGPWAIGKMFEGDSVARAGLPSWCPTDPQAEVQVLQSIPPELIGGLIIDRKVSVSWAQSQLDRLDGGKRFVEIHDFPALA